MRSLILGLMALATVALGISVPAHAQQDGAVILMYHRFAENEYPSTNIRLEQLDAHIATLKDGGFNVVPLQEIIDAFEAGESLPDRTVAITIDDAVRSIYEHAWPRFRDAGFPFTIFVSTELIDQNNSNYMTWDQLRELRNAGVTFGNHTVSHDHMPELDPDTARREIEVAQQRLAAELDVRPDLFAFPYGEASREIMDIVAALGFRAAFGQHSAVAFASHERFYLPRFALNENFGGPDRFNLLANAKPLIVDDVSPADPTIGETNPPAFGFTIDPAMGSTANLQCFAFAQGPVDVDLERLGDTRIEVRLGRAFPPGRARVNCTMPAGEGRWRWFGMQYYVPRS